MPDFETRPSGLPMLTGPTPSRPLLVRGGTDAAFASQLLAEREHLAPQRARRRTTPEGAVGAYTQGARVAVRRMPMGYRTSIIV